MKILVVGKGQMGNALFDTITEAEIDADQIGGKELANHSVSEYDYVLLSIPGEIMGKQSKFHKIVVDHLWKNGAIIIEMSNPWNDSFTQYQRAIELQQDFSVLENHPKVIKAFNSISAFDLVYKYNRTVKIVGDDKAACKKVSELTTLMGLKNQIVNATFAILENKDLVEDTFFAGWKQAGIISFIFLISTIFYSWMRYLKSGCCGNMENDQFWTYVLNKSFAWSSLWIFGFVYLLGAIAEVMPKPLGQRFVDLLFLRKHLSIIALFFAVVHALDSLLLISPNYYKKYFIDDKSMMIWNYELHLQLGVFSFVIFIIVGLTTVPSISESLNWQEWIYLQRNGGILALIFATAHVVLMGYKGWKYIGDTSVKKGLPSITFISTVPVMVVLLFRLVVSCLPDRCKPKSRRLQTSTFQYKKKKSIYACLSEDKSSAFNDKTPIKVEPVDQSSEKKLVNIQ